MSEFGALRNEINIVKTQLRDVKDNLVKKNDQEELKKEIFKDVSSIV